MSAKQVDQLRKQIAQLEAQLADKETENALLQGEDSAQDLKLDQLTKLQAQKVRALMRSIQELKKENATLKRQSAEHKRSDLIEKLKTEIGMQDVVIEALRSLANNEDLCNQKIAEFLNRGPPRVRAVSREEMRIEIKKLKGTIASLQAKVKGAKAADDFDKMVSSQAPEEEKGIDTQHNEKIVELLEELENLRVEVSSKDVKIEYLKKTVQKLNLELGQLRMKESELEFTGQAKTHLETQMKELQGNLEESASGQASHASTIQEKELEIRTLKQHLQDLERQIKSGKDAQGVMVKQYRSDVEDMKDKLAKAEADNKDLRSRLDSKGRQGDAERQKLKDLMNDKDQQIANLTAELRTKSTKVPELQHKLDEMQQSQLGNESLETELLLLREQLAKLAKSKNVPDDLLQAERAKSESYRKRTLELSKQIADLQETVEQYESHMKYLQKQGAAIHLHNRRQEAPASDAQESEDYKAVVKKNLQLENDLALLTSQLQQLEQDLSEHKSNLYEQNKLISILKQEAARRPQPLPADVQGRMGRSSVSTIEPKAMKTQILAALTGMFPRPNVELGTTTAEGAIKASGRIKESILRVLAK